MKHVIPLSDNLGSFDLRVLREVAKQGWDADLSTTVADGSKPLIVMGAFTGETNDLLLKHFFFSYIILTREDNQIEMMSKFESVSLSPVPSDMHVYANIASARLSTWVDLIKAFSTQANSLLPILNEIQNHLESRDLGFLFRGSVKKPCRLGYTLG